MSEQPVQHGPSTRAAARPMHAMQAPRAARRYFLGGWTIKKIAAELGVSRFKAARLRDWARGEGLVRIEIVNTIRSDAELSAELRAAYGLADALVVADLDGAADAIVRELAEVAALAVAELVSPNDVVGISWGRILDLLVEHLPELRARRVVQLIGGLATLESASGGIELVRSFAAKAHTEGYPLLAPVLVRDLAAAESLRRDPIIAETLKLIDDVTVVVAGVGAWGDPCGSRMIEVLHPTSSRNSGARAFPPTCAGSSSPTRARCFSSPSGAGSASAWSSSGPRRPSSPSPEARRSGRRSPPCSGRGSWTCSSRMRGPRERCCARRSPERSPRAWIRLGDARSAPRHRRFRATVPAAGT